MNEIVVGALLLATALLFSLEIRRRRLAEMQLQETLASVERQVEERTEALSKTMDELEAAMQVRDQILATASHELRTPLNAILGWVHVLSSGAARSEEERRHAISAIERNAKSQTRLIEDLLDVSSMIQGGVRLSVAPMNLRAIVDAAVDTIKPTAAARDITLAIDRSDADLPVIGDDQRLQQVIWNLLANAVKYSAAGGRVTISAVREGDRAVVTVKDSGEGIDPAFLPYVFEPFRQGSATRTMRSGLGLGLAIVKQLVDLHGGRIMAESEGANRGAQFTLSLPLAHGETASSAA